MAMPRVASGVLPKAATSKPNAEDIKAHETQTPIKPAKLPSMRTPKTIRAKTKPERRISRAMKAPLKALPPSSKYLDKGAERRRFHSPRCRCRSSETPVSRAIKSINWIPVQIVENGVTALRINADRRLVQKEDLWIMQKCGREI